MGMSGDTEEMMFTNDVVKNRYDSEEAAQFYKIVMGDGGDDIHYGVFESPEDTTLQAAANTVSTLISLSLNRMEPNLVQTAAF